MKSKAGIIVFLSGIFSTLLSFAGEGDTSQVKRFKVYPFPAIGYSPETRWYIGAVALFNLRLSENNSDKPSTVELEFNYTQNDQFIYSENHELRFGKNKFLFYR